MSEIGYTLSALRSLRKLPKDTSNLIQTEIRSFARDPSALNKNVKPIKGCNGFRLSVGDWHVIMDDQGNVLALFETEYQSHANE